MKKFFLICSVCFASLLYTGCATLGVNLSHPSEAKEKLAAYFETLTPENSVLMYHVATYNLPIYQQNPKIGYKFYLPLEDTNSWYTTYFHVYEPVPVGSELVITDSFSYKIIQGVDFVADKPGLHYFKLENEKSHEYEIPATKTLLEYVKGTVWEPVVAERLKELEDEEK